MQNITEEIEWLNVQNVEPKSQKQRRPGRWQDAQTNQENECNWKSGFLNAQKVTLTPLSVKYSAKRKSKHTQPPSTRNLTLKAKS
jgi:hypothetical protein